MEEGWGEEGARTRTLGSVGEEEEAEVTRLEFGRRRFAMPGGGGLSGEGADRGWARTDILGLPEPGRECVGNGAGLLDTRSRWREGNTAGMHECMVW